MAAASWAVAASNASCCDFTAVAVAVADVFIVISSMLLLPLLVVRTPSVSIVRVVGYLALTPYLLRMVTHPASRDVDSQDHRGGTAEVP